MLVQTPLFEKSAAYWDVIKLVRYQCEMQETLDLEKKKRKEN